VCTGLDCVQVMEQGVGHRLRLGGRALRVRAGLYLGGPHASGGAHAKGTGGDAALAVATVVDERVILG